MYKHVKGKQLTKSIGFHQKHDIFQKRFKTNFTNHL
jgi:hypothetical protein